MKLKFDPIPKEKQLEAISKLSTRHIRSILQPFIKSGDWPKEFDWNLTKYNIFFDFTREELVLYLKDRKDTCDQYYRYSLDKKCGGPFLIEKNGKFLTGWVPKVGGIKYYNEYGTIYEATADFILMEWGMIECV